MLKHLLDQTAQSWMWPGCYRYFDLWTPVSFRGRGFSFSFLWLKDRTSWMRKLFQMPEALSYQHSFFIYLTSSKHFHFKKNISSWQRFQGRTATNKQESSAALSLNVLREVALLHWNSGRAEETPAPCVKQRWMDVAKKWPRTWTFKRCHLKQVHWGIRNKLEFSTQCPASF